MLGGGIARVLAWEALDSRGRPTVACRVELRSGVASGAVAPAGASTGAHEARELRDGGARYGGWGCRRAVERLMSEVAPKIVGMDAADQRAVDERLRELDGTTGLARLGANTVVAVSVAVVRAAAAARGEPLYRHLGSGPPLLPLPMVNVLSGGAHAGKAVDFQDFLVVPVGASSFSQAIEWAARVRAATAAIAQEAGQPVGLVADEGGLGPRLASNRDALELLVRGIERSGLVPGLQVAVAIDAAATQLVRPDGYCLAGEGRLLSGERLVEQWVEWVRQFPVVSLEDPLGEDDWTAWQALSSQLGERVQLVGDDLFVTDPERLGRGVEAAVANAVLVKPNQVGTVTDAAEVVEQARAAGYATIVSARSGDTEEAWLADLAVGWRAGQIKVGSTTRSERTAKWNRLLEIEATAPDAIFAGSQALDRPVRRVPAGGQS